MTDWDLKVMKMCGIASDALDTARNALREIYMECELIGHLILEIDAMQTPTLGLIPNPPPEYERPTGEGLTFAPDTRDAIGYIEIRNATIKPQAGIEAEFLKQIQPFTAQTLHLKQGINFLIAVKNGRIWNFLPPVENLTLAISHLSNHKGKLRMLIHYTK